MTLITKSMFHWRIPHPVLCMDVLGAVGLTPSRDRGRGHTRKGGDALLDGQVTIKGILLDKGSNPMRAKVRLKNNFWFELILEVKLSFFDENGVKLGNACGWKPVTLEKGLDEWVECVAPNGQAKNFRLAMKKAGS